MATKYVTIGHASTSSNGTKSPGDQGQRGTPDESGEVLLRRRTVAEFNSYYGNGSWKVVRPVDGAIATAMANLMVSGCNNKNIGYLYGGKDMWCQGGKHKVNASSACSTDCSGLVSECISEAIGKKFYYTTADLISKCESLKLGKKNVFYKHFVFQSMSSTPVYNGDVMVIRTSSHQHTCIVVAGRPREGQKDVNPGTGMGSSTGAWMPGWGLTIFAAIGDSGQPNGRGVANPSVNCKATALKDGKGFVSVAAGQEWEFNTRFEIQELPGYIFQVDDRGRSDLFNGEKHLDVFVENIKVPEYVTLNGKQVSIQTFAGQHQWYKGRTGDLHVRVVGGEGIEYGEGDAGYLEAKVEYSFVPRTEKFKPDDESYEYYKLAYGKEYGKCNSGSYAWGRFSEIIKEECKLGHGMVKSWFKNNEDRYLRGAAPSLGAVMCFTPTANAGLPGFACVVELVHPDYIMVSYCDNNNKFHYTRFAQSNGTWNRIIDDAKYAFQGFIYPPDAAMGIRDTSALHRFISIANSYEGDGSSFTFKMTGNNIKILGEGSTSRSSASFITAVARATGGVLGVILPNVHGCSSIGFDGDRMDMGTWFDGPAQGGSPAPQVGDIVLLRNNSGKRSDKYQADNAGIVTKVDTLKSNAAVTSMSGKALRKYTFTAIGVTKSGVVKSANYSTTNGLISGIFRPDWSRVDGTSEIAKWISSPIGMYNEGTTIEDAAVREVAYAAADGKKFKPSIKKTEITLCAINYTGMLSNMYSVLAGLRANMDEGDQQLVPDIWSYTELAEFDIDVFATEPHPSVSSTPPGNAGYTTAEVVYVDEYANVDDVVGPKDGSVAKTKLGTMEINGTSRALFNILYSELKNKGAVVGVMAAMWEDSKWLPSFEDLKTGKYGIMGWIDASHDGNGRASRMRMWCTTHGNNTTWKKNLSGQLSYLFHETTIDNSFGEGWRRLKTVTENVAGAQTAAEIFITWLQPSKANFGTNPIAYGPQASARAAYCEAAWDLFIGKAKKK